MNNRIKKIKKNKFSLIELITVTACVTVIFSVLTGFIIHKISSKKLDTSLSDINDTYNDIIKNYYEDIDKQGLADSAIDGMMSYLDEKYSRYMDENSTTELNDKLEGEYQGIGVQIAKIDDKVIIYQVFDDSPAKKVGIEINDIVVSVDDTKIESETNLEDVVSLIKGKNKVKMVVLREKEEKTFNIDVKTLNVPCITKELFEINGKKVGYIYIESFTSTADKQFKNAYNSFKDADSIIVDVRSNTGGYLNVASNIASLFLRKGKIIYSLESKKGRIYTYDETDTECDKKVVVLTDSVTASASEVLAAALKESYGAVIIGNKSYGKGRVQQTSTLSDETMVKYTTAKWYSPLGNSFDGVGITPGINVNLTKEYANNPSYETDAQLQKALEFLTK